jgi:hypothetical protein
MYRKLILIALLACGVAACDDEVTPTGPTTPQTVTETFSGTIAPNGAATHNFAVGGSGSVVATLKTIGADNTLVVGLSLGQWSTANSTCSLVLTNDTATGNGTVSGTMTGAGNLCVRIADVAGNIAAGTTAAYSIEVVHP